MSLGLPIHLAPRGVSLAYSRACHVMAAVCIAIAVACDVTIQATRDAPPAWLALVPMLIALALLDRRPSWPFTVAYLLTGTAGIAAHAWLLMSSGAVAATDDFVMSMPKIALVLVGGVAVGVTPAIAWGLAGFVLAETATIVPALEAGATVHFDGSSVVTVSLVVTVLGAIGFNRYRVRVAGPSLHRAARDEHFSHVRHRMEVKAAAMLHDTVLTHLAALAHAPTGRLHDELRDQIARDLDLVVGEEWLIDVDESVEETSSGWRASLLAGVIDDVRLLGLTVEVSGDREAFDRLSTSRSTAVALAAKQCLVNVIKHAGTDRAEIVLYGSEHDISVMIIDTGRGFDVGDAGPDRLGLRHSVHTRIEAVQGTVQVWSTVGRGTSVLIRVPTTDDDYDFDEEYVTEGADVDATVRP